MERQFEILVVGRIAGDLVLDSDKHSVKFVEKGVEITSGNEIIHIRTKNTPSKENDKVTSLDDLNSILPKLNYFFRWGGGANNSLFALGDLRVRSPNMGATLLTPSKPYLQLGNEVKDESDYLARINLGGLFLNFTDLNFNLNSGGENKLIIRNKERGNIDFKLTREHKGTIEQYIIPADGILINALNDPDMTKHIVQTVYNENQDLYSSNRAQLDKNIDELVHQEDYLSRPMHRKIFTVITHTAELDWATIVNDILPYTGLIMNGEDALRIFYSPDTEKETRDKPDERMEMIVRAMAQMRRGIPTQHGVMRKVEDPFNNIYVTLGANGHLVALQDTIYHMRTHPDIVDYIGEQIKNNKASTSGSGDAAAGSITRLAVLGLEQEVKYATAMMNTTVCKALGINRVIHESEIDTVNKFDISKYYKKENLLRV